MTQDEMKMAVAQAAIEYLEFDSVIGVGTGSTVNFFIDELAKVKHKIDGAVASSKATEERLKAHGIRVLDLNHAGTLSLYVDGADEATKHKHLIKGGGAALTREKIVAQASEQFICIIDQSKLVDVLGEFPLPIEVIPMARSLIGRQFAAMGALPEMRVGVTTDNGNVILDVQGLKLLDPPAIETKINQWPGVVCNGLFALRGADKLLIASKDGVTTID